MADRIITCKQCGCAINLDAYKPSLIRKAEEEQLCFDCAYWNDVVHNPRPNHTVISGSLYQTDEPRAYLNGNELRSAKWHYLLETSSRKTKACTKCKLIGVVPQHFKDALPDRYRFITKEAFVRIQNYCGTQCLCKGCWDRYYCFWYNRDEAEPHGAWNKVPDNYIIGGEKCESFINKYTMYDISH